MIARPEYLHQLQSMALCQRALSRPVVQRPVALLIQMRVHLTIGFERQHWSWDRLGPRISGLSLLAPEKVCRSRLAPVCSSVEPLVNPMAARPRQLMAHKPRLTVQPLC